MRLSDATTAYQYAINGLTSQTQRWQVPKHHIITVWCRSRRGLRRAMLLSKN